DRADDLERLAQVLAQHVDGDLRVAIDLAPAVAPQQVQAALAGPASRHGEVKLEDGAVLVARGGLARRRRNRRVRAAAVAVARALAVAVASPVDAARERGLHPGRHRGAAGVHPDAAGAEQARGLLDDAPHLVQAARLAQAAAQGAHRRAQGAVAAAL